MHGTPQLPGSPAACRAAWTDLADGGRNELAWDIRSDGHLVVAAIRGELDLATVPDLAGPLSSLAAAGQHLILDLGALEFCDCTGLSLVLRVRRQAASAGGTLQLAAAVPRVARLMALTGTGDLLGARPCRPDCCIGAHLPAPGAGLRPG
ncbi:MAG TPA: STAS domain-containing protein [Streptosporangiaceae bacterium]|jgi:anti-anti-sigma factor